MIKLQLSAIDWFKPFLKIFYPPKCILCHGLLDDLDGEYVCRLCMNQYHQERPNLLKGQTILQEEVELAFIGQSREELADLIEDEMSSYMPMQIIALFPYTENYRRSILRWKYGGIRKYAKGFAKMLVEEQQVFKELKPDVLIPVPLAPSRMRKRGFNQALDLAKAIGGEEKIPVWDCLKRYKDTKPQAECSREERYKNIQGSISFKKEYGTSAINKADQVASVNYGGQRRQLEDGCGINTTAEEGIKEKRQGKEAGHLIEQETESFTDEWGIVEERENHNSEIHSNKNQDNEITVKEVQQDINQNKDYQNSISSINYVALVDDIYTTGSTAKECIKILKEQYIFKDAKIVMIVVGKGNF